MPDWMRPGQLTTAVVAAFLSVWLAYWVFELIVLTIAGALVFSVLVRTQVDLRAERRKTARLQRIIDASGFSASAVDAEEPARQGALLPFLPRRRP